MNTSSAVVLLDAGHGADTAGKRSPDGSLCEYAWARTAVDEIDSALTAAGIRTEIITPEDSDIPLSTRVARVNKYCSIYGASNCLCVSVHVNAAGDGSSWMSAHGWSVYVSNNASAASKSLASYCASAAGDEGLYVRTPSPGTSYWTQNLAICRDTACPAILTENLFMDNKDNCEYLLSDDGRATIVRAHVTGILNYISAV